MKLGRKEKTEPQEVPVETPPHSWAALERTDNGLLAPEAWVISFYLGRPYLSRPAAALRATQAEAEADADRLARQKVGLSFAVVKVVKIITGVAAVTTREVP